MHDKTVRRRRAVLALLVVLSLILISASFGSSGGGPLHTVQSGFLDVLSPVETGASKALTPVHDLFNWVGDVFHASSQRDKLRKELAQANATIIALQAQQNATRDAAKLQRLDSTLQLTPDGPVDASVIGQPESLWVSHVTINAGSGDGVGNNDPVIDADGLIGTVTEVAADSAIVTLINDPTSGVSARDSASREMGVIGPQPGSPGELVLSFVSRSSEVKVGDLIVTAGERATDNASLFPANLLIGKVTAVPSAANPSGSITVAPAADLTSLQNVQVLVQIAGVAQLRILGVNADLSPLVVAAAGFLTGALPGAVFGFGVGIFVDLAFAQTLGISALVYSLVGYGAGRVRELRAPEAPFTPLALGAAATAVATCGYSVLEFTLGITSPISLLLLRDILLTIALNSLIAVPVYSVVRRWLIPALPEDPRRRRRRAYTTGGLSPLSRP